LGRAGWRAEHASAVISRAPEYSEHTEQVLREIAGLGVEEIEQLAAVGAIVLPKEVTA
jgi:crotonobetainyl-CoA:carnitine CoA-transferase CaiB-like acyl-CoA transferase